MHIILYFYDFFLTNAIKIKKQNKNSLFFYEQSNDMFLFDYTELIFNKVSLVIESTPSGLNYSSKTKRINIFFTRSH